MYKVKFADIGEGLTEGKVVEVLVKVNQQVKAGDSLFFVETDKVNSEIPAPVSGKIAKILIQPDQEIKVGEVVMEIEETDSINVSSNPESSQSPIIPEKAEENASVVGSTPVSDNVISRVNQQDNNSQLNQDHLIKATPLARRMAVDLKIDLKQVKPSGPGNRILVKDLQDFNKLDQAQPAVKNLDSASTLTNPEVQQEFESKPMSGIRKATVKAMTFSHQNIASFSGIKSIDLSKVVDLRAQLKPIAEAQQIKLTYLAFIVKAVVKSLQEMPQINVQIDEANKAIKYLKNINIGIAVDTADGLVVPVIKQADKLSVLEIANAINDLATKAKNKKLGLKDMSGGTFTISNFGTVGLEFATPIINPPESAILGVGMMIKTPVYVGDSIEPRFMMPFSMTADHRIIDGADVGRFLQKVETYLNNPLILMI